LRFKSAIFLTLAFLLLVSPFAVASRVGTITPMSDRRPDVTATSLRMVPNSNALDPVFPWVGVKVNVYPNAPSVQYVNASDYFYVAHGWVSPGNWSGLTADTQKAFLDPQQANFTLETKASNFQNLPLTQFTYYDNATDIMSSLFWFQFHPGDLAPGAYSFNGTWSVTAKANPPNYTAERLQNTITLIVTIITLNFPPGKSIPVSLLEYTNVTSPYPKLPSATGPICNITASGFKGNVTVGIHYDPNLVSNLSKLVMAQFDFLPGDVNYDGKVSLADLVALAHAYGSKPGDTNWNPNADIDSNGIVGLSDLVILAQHYGLSAEWIDRPTTVDTANNFVYCTTDHFSGIGIHQSQ
jgi:hypothetical protein